MKYSSYTLFYSHDNNKSTTSRTDSTGLLLRLICIAQSAYSPELAIRAWASATGTSFSFFHHAALLTECSSEQPLAILPDYQAPLKYQYSESLLCNNSSCMSTDHRKGPNGCNQDNNKTFALCNSSFVHMLFTTPYIFMRRCQSFLIVLLSHTLHC